jgi:malonyl-CoA O-methyltransferase
MHRPTKARIRQSFERAAATYDSAAEIQRQICAQLAATLPSAREVSRLLDAGCGTGYALALLQARYPNAQAIALDLAPAMLQRISTPCCQLAGDLEHLPLASNSLDLYWSSLAVQWCELPQTLAEAHRVLKAQGQIAIATLGPQTFHELRQAFSTIDDYQHTLGFHSAAEIRQLATQTGLVTVNVQNSPIITHYADFKSLLKAVKAVGANQIGAGRRTSLMSRSSFKRAEAAFEQLRVASGLPLTYDLITLNAKK